MATPMVTFAPGTNGATKQDKKEDEASATSASTTTTTLVKDTSPLAQDWVPLVQDTAHESYAYVLPFDTHHAHSWTTYTQLDTWFDALHPSQFVSSTHSTVDKRAWTPAMYHGQPMLRQTAWVTLDDDCKCEYGYSDTWQEQSTCPIFQRTIREIASYVQDATGQTFNACNLNYYPAGAGLGWHADDEFLWDAYHQPITIVSLSLCRGTDDGILAGARKFMIRPKHHAHISSVGHHGGVTELVLKHGDLMTMEGFLQKFYLHSVWPGDSMYYQDDPYVQGERINLTFRTIVQHLDGSPASRDKTCPLAAKVNKQRPPIKGVTQK